MQMNLVNQKTNMKIIMTIWGNHIHDGKMTNHMNMNGMTDEEMKNMHKNMRQEEMKEMHKNMQNNNMKHMNHK